MQRIKSPGTWSWFAAGLLFLAACQPAAAQVPVLGSAVDGAFPGPVAPPLLRRPLESPPSAAKSDPRPPETMFLTPFDAPTGFAGPSGVAPSEDQQNSHFVPVEDRWRVGFPVWDRYGKGHPPVDDYPYQPGRWWDPFNLNVVKGDYPILGQHTFLDVTATSITFFNPRTVPTPTTPFESTERPFTEEFFGRPQQLGFAQFFSLSLDLFHGDAAFKPVDWRLKVTPVANINALALNELGVVSPNVLLGTTRYRTFTTLEEWFFEYKLADLSPNYDFLSVRLGSQPFINDFRGFIFSDVNRGARLFGTRENGRDQFNVALFAQQEKDTNSFLNTFRDRHQLVGIANYYRQDFLFPGYTAQLNLVYNHDEPTFHFDKNGFLVRPEPVGVFTPHQIDTIYLGWTGDGHIGPYNLTHAFYYVVGYDTLNAIANQPEDVSAEFAAIELSYDRDWARFRASFLWSSGDNNPNNKHATGFDAVFDNPNFAGGQFSYWQSQALGLFSTNLKNRGSFIPDLRTSKIQGQANYVNPGVMLCNFGIDIEFTPKLRMINNLNFLWFDETAPLEVFTFQGDIHHFIGVDASIGLEYRPLLSNNIIMQLGVSSLFPGRGLRDLYDPFNGTISPLFAALGQVTLQF